jgi:hypothetical protein
MPRQRQDETPADFCRRMGWGVGTRIQGVPDSHIDGIGRTGPTVHITAMGENRILARCTHRNGESVVEDEALWTLELRDWEVAP